MSVMYWSSDPTSQVYQSPEVLNSYKSQGKRPPVCPSSEWLNQRSSSYLFLIFAVQFQF